MRIFAISDLHLALGADKPMDIFGGRWSNYMDKLKSGWEETVTSKDIVIMPGDISWATYLDQSADDFRFIEELPGKKIISKGNHDYWWSTMAKLNQFLERNGFQTINFMHNNCFSIGNYAICGSRGWECPGGEDFSAMDLKIYNRELQRLELSLKSAVKNAGGDSEIIAALHFPPFDQKGRASGFVEIMKRYGVKKCVYGHLHGESLKYGLEGVIEDIEFMLVSADHIDFRPLLICSAEVDE